MRHDCSPEVHDSEAASPPVDCHHHWTVPDSSVSAPRVAWPVGKKLGQCDHSDLRRQTRSMCAHPECPLWQTRPLFHLAELGPLSSSNRRCTLTAPFRPRGGIL